MKLLIDMNLSPRWVERLSAASLTAVHWSSVGRVDAPDAEIMAATHGIKPSVVHIRSENLSPTSIGETLIAALQQMAPERAAHRRSEPNATPTPAPGPPMNFRCSRHTFGAA